jgi:hypothetical protein
MSIEDMKCEHGRYAACFFCCRQENEKLRENVLIPLDALIGDLEEVAAKSEMVYAPAILKKLFDVRYALSDPASEDTHCLRCNGRGCVVCDARFLSDPEFPKELCPVCGAPNCPLST